MGTKNTLTQPKYDEGGNPNSSRSLQESPNPNGKLRVPIAKPLPQLHLYGFLFGGELDVQGVHVTKNEKQ